MKYKIKNKYLLLVTLSSVFFFLFTLEANAALPLIALAGIALIPLVLGLLKGFASILILIAIASAASSISGRLLDLGIKFQNTFLDPEKITVIQTVWAMLRDFVNIFFILILLAIAFATIFNIKNYKASDLLPKLIIAALLINFSLIITIEVIKLLWIPAAVFLKPLGEGISGGIVNALNIQNFFDADHLVEFIKQLAQGGRSFANVAGTEAIFRSIILVINAFLLSWMALIIWARIPILIGLMMVSPLAWLGLTLPAIQKQTWGAWWQKLFCWGSIPIPLFGLIYFTIFFNQRLEVGINQAVSNSILKEVLPLTAFTVGDVLIWLITVGIFLAGMMYIKGLSCSMYGWMTAGFGKTWGGIRKGVGATVDWGYAARGYKGAVGQVQKELTQGGIPIFGKRMFGVAQREAREARREDQLAGMLGLGPTYAAERKLVDESGKASRDIENRLKKASTPAEETQIIDELRTAIREGKKDPETLAGFTILAKKGQLDVTIFNQAVDDFKNMPLALSKVFSEWKEGKFGGVSIPQFQEILRDSQNRLSLDAKRIMINFMASDDGKRIVEDRNYTYGDYARDYQVSGGKNSELGRRFRKFASEAKPTVVGEYNYNFRGEEFENPADYPADIADAVLKQIKKTGSKDFTKYGKDVWNDPEFKAALGDLLNNKATADIGNARKYAEEVRKWLIRESKDEDELRIFNDAATMAGI